jgi:hypothetical protein
MALTLLFIWLFQTRYQTGLIVLFYHMRMGHGFRFLLPPLTEKLWTQNTRIIHDV